MIMNSLVFFIRPYVSSIIFLKYQQGLNMTDKIICNVSDDLLYFKDPNYSIHGHKARPVVHLPKAVKLMSFRIWAHGKGAEAY